MAIPVFIFPEYFFVAFALEDLTYAISLGPMRTRLAFILSSQFNEWPDHIFPFFQGIIGVTHWTVIHFITFSPVDRKLFVFQTTNINENEKYSLEQYLREPYIFL